jgi:hypothetical protein
MNDKPDEPADAEDDEAMRALLKRSLHLAEKPDLLGAVQRKLRQRSQGKFYADGWSTSTSRVNYLLVALLILALLVAAYVALGPVSVTPG